MTSLSRVIATFILAFVGFGAHLEAARAQALFGPEWTFTNREIREAGKAAGDLTVATPENARARDALSRALLKSCRDCRLTLESNRYLNHEPLYVFHLSESHAVKIDVDPWVVEVNALPQTRSQFFAQREFYENVFAAAQEVGLKAHKRISGGHIHIDFASAFGSDELLARNFIVDIVNRPELAMGVFGEDYLNAPPLAVLNKTQIRAFSDQLALYDAGRISFEAWLESINSIVYARTYADFQPKPTAKFQAVNLLRALSGSTFRTVELRFFRPQKTFEHFLLATELLEARIESLKSLEKPIPFLAKQLKPGSLSDKTKIHAFQDFVTAAHRKPAAYRILIPSDLRPTLGPLVCVDAFGGQ